MMEGTHGVCRRIVRCFIDITDHRSFEVIRSADLRAADVLVCAERLGAACWSFIVLFGGGWVGKGIVGNLRPHRSLYSDWEGSKRSWKG